ncbi:MAG: NUDIX domain-containing protein [Bacteroidota bacterium]
MPKKSAGLLVYRQTSGGLEVLLVHPGGPFFKKKDAGVWSVPKGEYDDNEEPLAAARREFTEETGLAVDGTFISLTPVKQKSGKIVIAWAIEADLDVSVIKSNLFPMEWPPRSGKIQQFEEVDRAEWFDIVTAREKMIPGQEPLLDELAAILSK